MGWTDEKDRTSKSSWVRGDDEEWLQQRSERCKSFDTHGYLHIRSFASSDEVKNMIEQMQQLVEKKWKVLSDKTDDFEEGNKSTPLSVFRTDEGQVKAQGSNDYFLESAGRVHFFAEPKAINQSGHLTETYSAKENKMGALNKAGHGLHLIPGPFRDYTLSSKVEQLVKELGWFDPVVPQSMYICKNPHVGGEVTSHQDSTFLHTTPKQTCLGLWLALHDATLENGCLWIRPRSHHEPLRRRFIRNPQHFGQTAIETCSNIATGDLSQPQMIFIHETNSQTDNTDDIVLWNKQMSSVPWEGSLPTSLSCTQTDALTNAGFVPVECKSGDLLLFAGTLDHLSLPNMSNRPRHTFQLHLVEGNNANRQWSKSNWLQYPQKIPFLRLTNTSSTAIQP